MQNPNNAIDAAISDPHDEETVTESNTASKPTSSALNELKDRLKQAVEAVVQAVDAVVNPQPVMVPVRIKRRPMPPRRRRR